MRHSSEHMFMMEEMRTPDYKARVIASKLEGVLKTDSQNIDNILELRDKLVDLFDQITSEDEKFRYHKLIIDCDAFLPDDKKSREILE